MREHELWLEQEAERTLARLLPRLEPVLAATTDRDIFLGRLNEHFSRLFKLLFGLYGGHYDFFYHLEEMLSAAATAYADRSASLRALDTQREEDPVWFQSESMVGGVCYVDLFAGDLAGVRDRIPYFNELGLTYLHLMPLFAAPEDESDGGYAVSSYRAVRPELGTMQDLNALAADLRQKGISLVLDFVFNHTSNEHDWARKALAGDREYQAYYRMFDDRRLPDQYEQTLREIFPEQAPGSFTYVPELDKWVWTTFRNFQWDLNYANPAVFVAMLEEMLFLANQGVEVLRLDAVAFVWKEMGTDCENLPQAHQIIQAYNALTRIVAPAMTFKSEAIVHPDFVAQYISRAECELSYHPTLMNLLWEALATREVRLLRHSMQKRFAIDPTCTWVNYVRCHDDIGWSFANEDADELGINGYDHRQFLNQFYTGRFAGSFATGLPFNYNPRTQDMRISGMAASLAGLEQAQFAGNEMFEEHAIRRLLLIHSVIISIGGIPLFYLGDELGIQNDYSYQNDQEKATDSRWLHRPRFDWRRAERRHDKETTEGCIFQQLRHMVQLRKSLPAFANGSTRFLDTLNPAVFGYTRHDQIMVLANFSERSQRVDCAVLDFVGSESGPLTDLLSGQPVDLTDQLVLEPYQFVWLGGPQG